MKRQQRLWLWVIPILLLATGLAAQRLADYPLDRDEFVSFENAGGMSDSPMSLFEVWEFVTKRDPDQAYGFPLILSIWGRVFGWSEYVVRLFPLFAGLLAITWIFRAGSDLFSPQAGLMATIFLMTSVYYTNFSTYRPCIFYGCAFFCAHSSGVIGIWHCIQIAVAKNAWQRSGC